MNEEEVIHRLQSRLNLVEVEPEAILPRGASAFARGPTGHVVGIKIGGLGRPESSIRPEELELIFQLPYIERLVLASDYGVKASIPETVINLKRLKLLWLRGFQTLPRQILELNLPLDVLEDPFLPRPDDRGLGERGNAPAARLQALMGEFETRAQDYSDLSLEQLLEGTRLATNVGEQNLGPPAPAVPDGDQPEENAQRPNFVDAFRDEAVLAKVAKTNPGWKSASLALRGVFVSLDGLEDPPPEIMRHGEDALRVYFKDRTEQELPLNEVKVILVGDGGSGKTSLVRRFLGEDFNVDEPQTHGINIRRWSPKGDLSGSVQLHLWDFGGQDIMHATHQFFLSKRSLYIVVLDGRKEEDPEYWLQHIESFGGDSPIIVVINKIDQNLSYDLNRKFLREKYKGIFDFVKVSCATRQGISDLAEAIDKSLQHTPILTTRWPKSWFNVKETLAGLTNDYISLMDYKHICDEQGVIGEYAQNVLVDFLHDLGIIVHFKDYQLLDTHVLDPKWVTEGVYRIINSRELSDSKGLLRLNGLRGILGRTSEDLRRYPVDKHMYLIELMLKFELCYRVGDAALLIPDLLGVQEPQYSFDHRNALIFVFEYGYLPRSIIPRFIVRVSKDIVGENRWRTGVSLHSALFSADALVKADEKAKRITVAVTGQQRRDYFAALRDAFAEIHRSFEKLLVIEFVPLPDRPDVFLEYRELIGHENADRDEIFVGRIGRSYQVKDLLNGIVDENRRKDDRINMTFNVSGNYISGSTTGRAGNVSVVDQVLGGQQGKPPMSDERLQMMLAYSFGFVFVVCILALIVLIPNPTLPQFEVFRIVMALAAGGIAAVVPGLLHLTLSRGQGLAIRAGGAMAVFVIVYFYSPASWIVH